ncbi:MAG: hypothetical protein U9P14_01165, partial [Gemmatimonadota bacterium]|nr:hypothetical protein [Gemmatimonadota bacterium]
NGSYKEYDMEGYRLYRSFVGPNDSHSELIGDFSKGGGNLQFFFVDKMEDDRDYGYRMKNGMKVWYALVPYDKNTDPATGASFSLPDPTSGKLWNKPGDRLYQVIPRSEASNFRAASLIGVTYEGGATVSLHSIDLAGDGSGNLLEAPQWLEPNVGEITFTPVNNEKISSDKIIYVECNYMGGDGGGCADRRQYATRKFKLVEGSQEVLAPARIRTHGSDVQTIDFSGPVDDAGVSYALSVPFQGLYSLADYRRAWHRSIDLGTYPGRVINFTSMGCGYDHDLGGSTRRPGTSPSMLSYMKNGRFTVTWKAAGSDMTLEVKDLSRGITMSAVDYPDEDGWGFMTVEGYGAEIAARRVNGTYYDEAFRYYTPKADRTVKMLDKIPADYPSKFGFWLNGLVWKVIDGMPADGTVMTIDNAYGSWNGDQTVFTQVADMPWMGEKWRIDVKASTLDPEDANLSKIRVVPNPYLATSFLDLSPQSRRIEFVNLPNRCTIRIFSLGGNLVNVLNHIGVNRQGWGDYVDVDRFVKSVAPVYTGYDNHGGTEGWNLRNRFGQTVASGLYFFHVTDQRGETHTGKFYIVN